MQVRKQEAEELGYQGKEVADYVKQEEALDREDRAAWRGTQTMQADLELAKLRAEAEEKRADEILMAEIQAEAEKKKRADKIQMAKVEADKELAIKELVLKPRYKPVLMLQLIHLPATEMLSSRPKLPAFINEKDKLDLQLPAFF